MTFIEQPHDVRWLRELGIGTWTRQLSGRSRQHGGDAGALEVIERTTLIPPYRGPPRRSPRRYSSRRILRASDRPEAVVVATTPWQWPAISRLRRARRVFDCADDWGLLVPARSAAVAALLERIGREADVVIADSPSLAKLFSRPEVTLVRNGADNRLLATPLSEPPEARSMAYAGTLSERLDTGLLGTLMAALPDWRLDLYGECRYKGCRDRPGPELAALLTAFARADHLAWHREPRRACFPSRRCSSPAAAPSARRRCAWRLDEALRLRGKRQADRLDALG